MALPPVILEAAPREVLLGSVAGFTAEHLWQAPTKTVWTRLEAPVVFKKQIKDAIEALLIALLLGFSSHGGKKKTAACHFQVQWS